MEIDFHSESVCSRFDLPNGQVVPDSPFSSIWWELNGAYFGWGDLSGSDVVRIQTRLNRDEIFKGWSVFYGEDRLKEDLPAITIESRKICVRSDIVEQALSKRMS